MTEKLENKVMLFKKLTSDSLLKNELNSVLNSNSNPELIADGAF